MDYSVQEVDQSYIVNVVQKSLHIIPTNVVAGELYEFTAEPSCRGTTIREVGVCLLDIIQRKRQQLAQQVRSYFHRGSIESYLVRCPLGRIHYAIQDYLPDALHVLSILFCG